jgi:hypothetical protein
MISMTWARFALAVVGILVWGYGYRVDDPMIRWIGIAFLAVAVLLRFVPRRRPPSA